MPKRMIWKQMYVSTTDLAARLTTLNFQPNKFHITALNDEVVLVVYVEKEIPNVE